MTVLLDDLRRYCEYVCRYPLVLAREDSCCDLDAVITRRSCRVAWLSLTVVCVLPLTACSDGDSGSDTAPGVSPAPTPGTSTPTATPQSPVPAPTECLGGTGDPAACTESPLPEATP